MMFDEEEHMADLASEKFYLNPTIKNARIIWLDCMKHNMPVPEDVLVIMMNDVEKAINDDMEKGVEAHNKRFREKPLYE